MGYPIKHKNPCNANASQGFSILDCYGFLQISVRELEDIAAVSLKTLIAFLATNDDLLELTQTCTGWDEVSADYVLLHAEE